MTGTIVEPDLRRLICKDPQLTGATVVPPGAFARRVGYIGAGYIGTGYIGTGCLMPLPAAACPLRNPASALKAFMARCHAGNIAVTLVGPA